jgi:hypothetical protein
VQRIHRQRRRRGFKYDVALSFAGEDRKHAALLHRHLTKLGFSVFYDVDRQAEIWGKTAEAFESIYGHQTRYVIPLISKHYVKKDWTRHEFESAKREARRRRSEFILPIRLDDTRLFGLHDDVIRIDARDTSIERIAQLFARKLQPGRRENRPGSGRALPIAAKTLLNGESRRAIGLIASAAIPMPVEYLNKLFPQHDWRIVIVGARAAGLITGDREAPEVTPQVSRALRSDVKEWRALNEIWIEHLTPLGAHYDTAAFLIVNLIRVRQFEDAARVAANITQHTRLGHWNSIYITLMRALGHRKVLARLEPGTQLELLNGLGHCLTAGGDYPGALKAYARLHSFSVRQRSSWGIGQSLINSGVVANTAGDDKTAAKHYLAAAAYARRRRDHFLLGRALGNLAQIYSPSNIKYAEQLLSQSLKAKRLARDSGGIVVGLAIRGSLAVSRKQYLQAARWFQRAASAGRRLGMLHETALSTYNHGRALEDAGRKGAALRLYVAAQKLASANGYSDVSVLSLHSIGGATFANADYVDSQKAATELLKTSAEAQHRSYRVVALHMLACASLGRGSAKESARYFRMALSEARDRGDQEWIIRCVVDSTRSLEDKGIGDPSRAQLRRRAEAEAANGQYVVSAGIWDVLARLDAGVADADAASTSFRRGLKCLLRSKTSFADQIDLCQRWYAWAWEARRYAEAVSVLRTIERIARKNGLRAEALAALDSRGRCLQEFGRYAEAESLHRDVVRESKRYGLTDQCERSLNNLGEALRHQGRYRLAETALRESEETARRSQRQEGALIAAHNRALALKSLRKYADSARILRRCRDEAHALGLWDAYLRNLTALASLAWSRGQLGAATRLYRQALVESRQRKRPQIEVNAALNLSRLLHATRQPRLAQLVLAKRRPLFDLLADASDWFETLARLYEANGHLEEAAATLKDAVRQASEAQGPDLAYLQSKLRRIESQLARIAISDQTLSKRLETEKDPKKRSDLMILRFERRIMSMRSRRPNAMSSSQDAFDVALQYSKTSKQHLAVARLYLLVGDHELRHGYARKLKGCKAYVMAIVSAVSESIDAAANVSTKIFNRLGAIDSAVSPEELEALSVDLRTFLTKDMSVTESRTLRFLMWPFELALKLAPLRDRPDDYLHSMGELTSRHRLDRLFR